MHSAQAQMLYTQKVAGLPAGRRVRALHRPPEPHSPKASRVTYARLRTRQHSGPNPNQLWAGYLTGRCVDPMLIMGFRPNACHDTAKSSVSTFVTVVYMTCGWLISVTTARQHGRSLRGMGSCSLP
jgi:hypothetical protein